MWVNGTGMIKGQSVHDIVLDTGCTQTMVRQDILPDDFKPTGQTVQIRCAHGDAATYIYLLANIHLNINQTGREGLACPTSNGCKFSPKWSQQYPWLTVCSARMKVFCYECRCTCISKHDLLTFSKNSTPALIVMALTIGKNVFRHLVVMKQVMPIAKLI